MTKEERREYDRKWRESHRAQRREVAKLYRDKKRAERLAEKRKLTRAARLAAWDASCAKNAAPVVIETRGGVVIETRGFCPIAPRFRTR